MLKPSKESKEPTKGNEIDHPDHYTSGGIEVIDIIAHKLTPEEYKGYLRGNIIKYLFRYQYKEGSKDLRKAQWYLARLLDEVIKLENPLKVYSHDEIQQLIASGKWRLEKGSK